MPTAASTASTTKDARTTRRRTAPLPGSSGDSQGYSVDHKPGGVALLAVRGHALEAFGGAEVRHGQRGQLGEVVADVVRRGTPQQALGAGQRTGRPAQQCRDVVVDPPVQVGRRYRGG